MLNEPNCLLHFNLVNLATILTKPNLLLSTLTHCINHKEIKMGAESYRSVTKYQEDTEQALSDLQQQIFAAGEYRYSEDAEAGDIDEAREFAAEDGTKSVLDIYGISDEPTMAHAALVTDDEARSWFGCTEIDEKDIHKIDDCSDFWTSMDRGEARYLILYKDGKPSQYYFAGLSFD